jgi:hypothetical protein
MHRFFVCNWWALKLIVACQISGDDYYQMDSFSG